MYPQYKRGQGGQRFILSDVDDLPMWSKKDLTTVKPLSFFDDIGGPNEKTSLQTANMIDKNKDFDVKRIEVNVMATDNAPLELADVAKIAILQAGFFIQIFTNEARRAYAVPLHALLKAPFQVAAAGASAYNPAWVVNGGANINMPDGEGLVLKGGEAFTCQLSSSVLALDLTGISMSIVLWGRRYALLSASAG